MSMMLGRSEWRGPRTCRNLQAIPCVFCRDGTVSSESEGIIFSLDIIHRLEDDALTRLVEVAQQGVPHGENEAFSMLSRP